MNRNILLIRCSKFVTVMVTGLEILMNFKIICGFFILVTVLFAGIGTAQKKIVHPMKPKDFNGLGLMTEFKVLAEASQAEVDKPFVFIVRDASTYAELQELVKNLPPVEELDFSENAVVAAFAGRRPTGGFTVDLRGSESNVSVKIISPAKGDMVTQVVTAPYKVVLVPAGLNTPLRISNPKDFGAACESYRVSSGQFEFSGGFAGIRKQFSVVGRILVMRYKSFATFQFSLTGIGKERDRRLSDTASGLIRDRVIRIPRIDAGSFSDSPHPPLAVVGTFSAAKMSMILSPHETNIADGYRGSGRLKAVKMQ